MGADDRHQPQTAVPPGHDGHQTDAADWARLSRELREEEMRSRETEVGSAFRMITGR